MMNVFSFFFLFICMFLTEWRLLSLLKYLPRKCQKLLCKSRTAEVLLLLPIIDLFPAINYTLLPFKTLLFTAIIKWHICSQSSYRRVFFLVLSSKPNAIEWSTSRWTICVRLHQGVKDSRRRKEKKKTCCVHDVTLWNTRKSLTLVVTDRNIDRN